MLRWIADAKDNLYARIDRGSVQIAEVRFNVELQPVVGRGESVVRQQSIAATVLIGAGRADLVPPATSRTIAKLK